MALAFGEKRDQDIGARHFVTTGILYMEDGALHDALEAGCRLRVFTIFDDQRHQLFVDVFPQSLAQHFAVDIAGFKTWAASGSSMRARKKVLEGRIFVMAIARQLDGAMQGLLQTARERRHRGPTKLAP